MHCHINFSSRFNYRANGGTGKHLHDQDWQIQFIQEGSAVLGVNDFRYNAREGHMLLIPQGASHQFRAGPKGLKTLEVKFSTKSDEITHLVSQIPPFSLVKEAQVSELLFRIVNEGLKKPHAHSLLSEALLVESLVLMARGSISNMPMKAYPSPAIQAATEYIYHHLGTNFSVVDMAKGCGYNQDYLYRTIKKTYGISAIAYVNRIRFEQAKRLMEHTDISLSEIAWNLGFDSIQYFSKFFRQHAGTSPTEYCTNARGQRQSRGTP